MEGIVENGISPDIFNGLDMVLCGDIHKRQTLRVNGLSIVYPGSLIRQNLGESASGHGYNTILLPEMNMNSVDI
jgi:DNA repair exonuclease SbcCD nuclease subunit